MIQLLGFINHTDWKSKEMQRLQKSLQEDVQMG